MNKKFLVTSLISLTMGISSNVLAEEINNTEIQNEHEEGAYFQGTDFENAPAIDFRKHPIDSLMTISDMGFSHEKMPPRFGVSILGARQNETGKIKNVSLNTGAKITFPALIPGRPDNVLDIDQVFGKFLDGVTGNVKTKADVEIARFDYYVLPFMQVHGLVGKFESSSKITFSDKKIQSILGKLGFATHKEHGNLWGVGGTLAGGYNDFFAVGDYTFVRAYPQEQKVTSDSHSSALRFGYNYETKYLSFSPYVGASYFYAVPLEGDGFSLNLSFEPVSPIAGMHIGLPNDLGVVVEGSFGDRKLIAVELSWRFDAPWDKRAAAKNAKKKQIAMNN